MSGFRAHLSLRIAYRHFRANVSAMVLSVLAVALGVALVVAVHSMNTAVLRGFLTVIDGVAGRASFSIGASDMVSFPEELLERVAAVPGVELAVPLVRGVAFPDDESGETLTVLGVDITRDADVRLYHAADDAKTVIPDPLLFLNTPSSIILGREFAAGRGLHAGDPIDLVTPHGVQRFTIRGLLDPEGLARTLHGRLVVMDLYAAERAFAADGQINQIDVVVDPSADVARTLRAVAATLPAGLTAQEPSARKDVIARTLGGFQAMLTAFSLLAVIAGFIVCYSRVQAIVVARTWEAGLLRAVGLRPAAVVVEMLKESLLLGVSGTSLGIPLGLLIGYYGLPFLSSTTALNFRWPSPSVEPTIEVGAVALGACTGVAAALLATIGPAVRLARSHPVVALASRDREIPAGAPTFRWGARAGLAVAILALVGYQVWADATMVGLLTTALIGLGAVACASPLSRAGGVVLSKMGKKAFGPVGTFALTHLRQYPTRSALTIATLGLGLGTVLLFGMLAWSFERTLVARLVASERSDMVISSAFRGGYRSAPLADALLEDLREIPGVALVAGEQSADVTYRGETIVLKACDPACFAERRFYAWPLEPDSTPNALELVAQGRALIITTSFARRYGLRPGATIELQAPNGVLTLPIAGVSSGALETAVSMSRELYQRHWNDTTLWTANVALQAGADYTQVEGAVARRLGSKYRLLILSRDELIDYFAGEVRHAFSLQYLLEAITFVLVVIAIGDALASGVVERTREFGMMRAVGLHRSRLFAIVMLEGAAIGIIGLVLASLTGLALGIFWVKVQFPALLGWDLDLHFPYTFALIAAGFAMVLCAAGSFIPAVRAARLSAAEALRHE